MMHIDTAVEMIALGLVVLSAHVGGRICRALKLSEVSGQLVGGALVGPYALHLVGCVEAGGSYAQALYAFHFFIFVFLGLVAFGIGEELHFSRLRKVGFAGFVICSVHAVITFSLISIGFFLVTRAGIPGLPPMPLWEAMLLGSIGMASAPAVAFVLMNQLRVEGRLRHVLGSVIVLTDLAGVLLFSILAQVGAREAGPGGGGPVHPAATRAEPGYLLTIGRELGMAILLGLGVFMLLRILVRYRAASLDDHARPEAAEDEFLHRLLAEHPSPSAEILLVILGAVSLGCGIAYYNHWPFLITAIVAGFMAANFHSHALFASLKIENITPVFNLGFFALVGAKISFDSLSGSGVLLALVYTLMRGAGKFAGMRLGCMLVGEDRKITACLPSLMLPQAGVAAVEAVYVSEMLGKPEIAAIVLPAIVFFEVSGVVVIERSLRRWRSWVTDEEKIIRTVTGKERRGPADAARLLLAHLAPERVVLDWETTGKGEVIEKMVDVARAGSEQHIDREQALQVLFEREQLAPTGFGNGIAIPHCRLMGLGEAVLVFARLARGVKFGGVDDSPCDLVLLMLTSARDPGQHLRLLSAAAHVLGGDEVRGRLRQARTREELLAVLQCLGEGAKPA